MHSEMLREKLLFMAPLTSAHGQGMVSLKAKACFDSVFHVEAINTDSGNNPFFIKFFRNSVILVVVFWRVITGGWAVIYFTPSRSVLGAFRDLSLLIAAFLYRKITGKKPIIVAHLHGSDLDEFLSKTIMGRLIRNFYLMEIDRMIVLSASHRRYALGEGFNRYIVLPNPCEISRDISNKKVSIRGVGGRINFAHTSNPHKDKGLDRAIRFCQEYFSCEDWRLDILGWTQNDFENIYGCSIENFCPDFSSRIHFCGWVDKAKKEDLLANCNVFLFFSNYVSEAQPVSVIEAILFRCLVFLDDYKMLSDFTSSAQVYFRDEVKAFLSNEFLECSLDSKAAEYYSLDKFAAGLLNSVRLLK
jgi:glycosyltransferase involved in cell wall biosynthesis